MSVAKSIICLQCLKETDQTERRLAPCLEMIVQRRKLLKLENIMAKTTHTPLDTAANQWRLLQFHCRQYRLLQEVIRAHKYNILLSLLL